MMNRLSSESQSTHLGEITIKKTPVLLTILYTVITFGIYLPVWFLRRMASINRLQSEEKLGVGVFVFAIIAYSTMLVMAIVSGTLEVIAEESLDASLLNTVQILDGAHGFISLVVGITILVQSFKVRRILGDHFNTYLKQEIEFSGIATFFLWIIYLQYKINRLDYSTHSGMTPASNEGVGTPDAITGHAA